MDFPPIQDSTEKRNSSSVFSATNYTWIFLFCVKCVPFNSPKKPTNLGRIFTYLEDPDPTTSQHRVGARGLDRLIQAMAAWMSRPWLVRIKGDRISGLFHPKEYPMYKFMRSRLL